MKTKWYTKIWPWMKKYWVLVINPLVIAIAYSNVYDKGFTGTEVLLGLTLFANIAYWGFVWFMGGWNKLNPQPEPPVETAKPVKTVKPTETTEKTTKKRK